MRYTGHMSFLQEFKKFAMRGNVVDLAVGVVIGTAFNKIVSSFVDDILMPPISILLGGRTFANRMVTLRPAEVNEAGETVRQAVTLDYGMFIQNVLDFVIIAFAVFILVKLINRLHEKEPPKAPPAPPREVVLLEEIRDAIKAKQ